MELLEAVLNTIHDGPVKDVRIGTYWTAVVVDIDGEYRCGLSSTVGKDAHQHGVPDIPDAGKLQTMTGRELAALAQSSQSMYTSVGFAAINALLPQYPEQWVDRNAEQVILEKGRGKRVALIGHFPFVPRCREQLEDFHVLELNPREGDLPASAAGQILPGADVVAITGMAMVNHTIEGLLSLCGPQATVLVLGPSTPLSPVLYDYGVTMISGAIVTDIEPVLNTLSQAGNFRQIHHAGVRLVTMTKE